MKTKQLLCLLVLTVSGNTFGSTMPAPMNVNEVAAKHFQTEIPTELHVMKKMVDMDTKYKIHPEIAQMHRELIIESWNAGRNEAYMKIGTYIQPAMSTMASVLNTTKKP